MRRRAFVQLGVTSLLVPLLPALGGAPFVSGCASSAASDSISPAPTGADGPPVLEVGTVDEGARVFSSDGRSALVSTSNHVVDLFDGKGARIASLGNAQKAHTHAIGTFNGPIGVLWDGDRVLVLERGNARIQAFRANGFPLGVLAETGRGPTDFAVDRARNVYVAIPRLQRIEVYSPTGARLRTITTREMNGPGSIAIAPDGTLHVVDLGSASIKTFDAAGRYVTTYGSDLVGPSAVRFDAAGRVWVADVAGAAILVYANGRLTDTIRPRSGAGKKVAPIALAMRADGSIYASVIPA